MRTNTLRDVLVEIMVVECTKIEKLSIIDITNVCVPPVVVMSSMM